MFKTILLTSFLAAFAFIAMPTSPALAHCGACGEENNHKAGKMMPCEKCVKAGKECNCGDKKHDKMAKKPCAKCAEAKEHYKMTGEKKVCEVCMKSDAKFKADRVRNDKVISEDVTVQGNTIVEKQVIAIDDGYVNKEIGRAHV